MNKIGASLRLVALAAAISAGLAGCNNSVHSVDIAETIEGIASDGIGIANTTLAIVDAQKQVIEDITTDENGRFRFSPGSHSYPFMLSISTNGKTYYSLLTGSDRQVNINAATTVISQLALNTSQLANAQSAATFKTITIDKIAQAEDIYLRAIRADSQLASQLFDVSPRTKIYTAGNVSADGDAYQQYMAMVEPSLSPLNGQLLLLNKKPYRFNTYTTVEHRVADDLLTGGLGDAGILGSAPGYLDPFGFITALELRKNAVYAAYHAMTDLSTNGGYGTLWGRVSQVPGVEYLGYADTGDGVHNVSTLVQIPDSFDQKNPCIVVVPSSGLGGVYIANPNAEWGLKRGCAVAVTDKGAGTAAEYIDTGDSYLIDGLGGSSLSTTTTLQFKSGYSNAQRVDYKKNTPSRFAFKFAHSQKNPEKAWGQNTLDAAKFAFYLLNERFGPLADVGSRRLRSIKPENTTVILAGDGEGGEAALAAVEQDVLTLVDGAVLAQPSAQTNADSVAIAQGNAPVKASGKSLLDYTSYANLYQPCAALATPSGPAAALIDTVAAGNRCASLKQKGLLTSDTLTAQASEAQTKLLEYGWQPESAELHGPVYVRSTAGYAMAYTNAYGKRTALENLCGLSYASVDSGGLPITSPITIRRTLFADGNGMPPYGGIELISNDSTGGARIWTKGVSPTTGRADYSFDTAYCLRSFALGKDLMSGAPLVDSEVRDADGKLISQDFSGTIANTIKTSINEVKLTAALQGRPTIILHGRNDALMPVNHSSRPYVAKSLAVDGVRSKLRYYEVLNAQHYEAALGDPSMPGFDSRYVPLRPYLLQSLDLMYGYLTLKQPLPESQVLRTVPRGGVPGAAPAISSNNVPPISTSPASTDIIRFSGSTLSIPN